MLRNYLIIVLRNLIRHKAFSLLNITCLAIGMAGFILITLFIKHELSYDRFHKDHSNIYRVAINAQIIDDFINVPIACAPMGPTMVKDFPEVLKAVRLDKLNETILISYEDSRFYEKNIIIADSTFFDIFSFKLLQGDPKTALKEKYNIVITKNTAKKYFGDNDPIGRMMKWNNKYNVKVTGVVEDPPSNSHFSFELICSFPTLEDFVDNERLNSWGSMSYYTYVKLTDGFDPNVLEAKLPEFMAHYFEEDLDTMKTMGIFFEPYLQPLTSIHLHSDLYGEISPTFDIGNIYIFSIIALFILLIACINYMNLSTARASKRIKEIGLRKTLGAFSGDLKIQFLGESILFCLIGLFFAFFLVEIFLGQFNQLIEKNLTLNYTQDWPFIIELIVFTLLVGILSGSYPAFYLSKFQPGEVLKMGVLSGSGKSHFRTILVIFQFIISIALIISTLIIYNQFYFLKNINLGFNKEHVVVIQLNDDNLKEKYETIKSELLSIPSVKSVSASSDYPGMELDGWGFFLEGYDKNRPWIMSVISVDHDFIDCMNMQLVKGRGFLKNNLTDTAGIIINETAAKKAGWEDPIGKSMNLGSHEGGSKYQVIGVVKDFYFSSLQKRIDPIVLTIVPKRFQYLSIKIYPGDISRTIDLLEVKWAEIDASRPFDYFFLDKSFDNLYHDERNLMKIFLSFTILAIVIACLGLLGLTFFSAEQRIKEIGIRKVFGAGIMDVVYLLSKEFIKIIFIANCIAWPIAWIAMDRWLRQFEYATDINIWLFVFAGFISLLIGILTVCIIAAKAGRANPVEALKYE